MSERELVTATRLLEILHDRLAEHRECDGCELRPPLPLREPREDGCNWSTDVHVSCHDGTPARCAAIAARVAEEVARDYNLRPSEPTEPPPRP